MSGNVAAERALDVEVNAPGHARAESPGVEQAGPQSVGADQARAASAQARPLRADAERNRRLILAAARELFAERGLEVTMDEIADRAGVGVGTAYRRFRNREELAADLFEAHAEELGALAEHAASISPAIRGLEEFSSRAIEDAVGNRGFGDLLIGTTQVDEKIAAVQDRLTPIVDALIKRAIADGDLRPEVNSSDFFVLMVMVTAVSEFEGQGRTQAWRRAWQVAFDGLRAGPGELPPGLTPEQVRAAKARHHESRR